MGAFLPWDYELSGELFYQGEQGDHGRIVAIGKEVNEIMMESFTDALEGVLCMEEGESSGYHAWIPELSRCLCGFERATYFVEVLQDLFI